MADVEDSYYSVSELFELGDNELLLNLKEHWGYSPDEPLQIIGRLKEIPAANENSFYILEEIRSVKNAALLLYPLKSQTVRHSIFVGKLYKNSNTNELVDGALVKALVDLSPKKKREEHNNPFELNVIQSSIVLLKKLPEESPDIGINIEGQKFIEQWICDTFLNANLISINEKIQNERMRSATLQLESEQKEKRIHLQKRSLSELTESYKKTLVEKQIATQQLQEIKTDMEYKMNTLRQFVEHRAQLLMELDLISQQDYDTLSGKNFNEHPIVGHDVKEVFDGKLPEAIKYVQAYMFNKGTVYRRAVLEDYFTLLSTHDLIVLAGDSGSGKTNLVKSFAEATGGKAIIIPVKPNWTSAEDLLGYYNPLEKKFLSTPFLDALLEAAQNPNVPYYICLDEMNLARVEYYFADFLSYLEERSAVPEIPLFSDTEAQHLVSEAKNFLSLITEVKQQLNDTKASSFLDLLRDDALNAKLHEMCGFSEGESLLKYHAYLRRLFSSYLSMPSRLVFPSNVRVIGAINVDETTHYLSPKILDRAHIMRFSSPLLSDWESIEAEIASFDIDINLPVLLKPENFGTRRPYPQFAPKTELVKKLIEIVKSYLDPLGIEFGLRTVRQAQNYAEALKLFDASDDVVLNNIILHKVLPKLMFDGEKIVDGEITRKDILKQFRDRLAQDLQGVDADESINCISELDRVLKNAEANDWVVNYWSR